LLSLAIADSPGVNVNESERERSGIIRRQFCGVRRVGAIFRGALGSIGSGRRAYFAGLVVERQWGSYPSMIVFLAIYFVTLWVAWVIAVWLTEPKKAAA
jgi:hypothetical protein